MKYSEAHIGRAFVIRLEDGELLQQEIEKFAVKKKISRAFVQVVGGVDKGSKVIVGPESGRANLITPMIYELGEMHEISGTGTIFPDSEGKPTLHLHISCGRKDVTVTGDVREGVIVWHVVEVIIVELLSSTAIRSHDKKSGFSLLLSE